MKRNLALIELIASLCVMGLFTAVIMCGCSSTSGTRTITDPQGNIQTLTIHNNRFLWSSQGIEIKVKDDKGFEVGLKIEKSNPDAQAFGAIAEGAARGSKGL